MKGTDLVIDGDQIFSQNDLQLIAAEHGAQDGLGFLDLFQINAGFVPNEQPQARRAMGNAADIARATAQLNEGFRDFCVFHILSLSRSRHSRVVVEELVFAAICLRSYYTIKSNAVQRFSGLLEVFFIFLPL